MKLTELAIAHMEADTGIEMVESGRRTLVAEWQRAHMEPESVDGIYGPKTGAALWALHRPSREDIVERALTACLPPLGEWPAVEYSMRVNSGMGEAFFGVGPFDTGDCSDFAAHCMGLPKHYKGKWYGTDAIFADAQGYNELYEEVERSAAIPGDLVVYGSKWSDGKRTSVGHVGVIVEVDGRRIATVDCSASSARTYGSAVSRRDRTDLWTRKEAIIARPVWIQ